MMRRMAIAMFLGCSMGVTAGAQDQTQRPKFDWAQDETQYGGEVAKAAEDTQVPPLFVALQEQLGLKLTATRGMVSAMVVDGAKRPVVD